MNNYVEKVKKIIEENIYMTIATSTLGGTPWISPLFFVYDKDYNLYWVSNKNALHSKLIRSNSRVAIVIFNSQAPEGEGDGVYFETNVIELKQEVEIAQAMEVWNKRATHDEFKIKKVGEVTGEGMWRMYKATPHTIYKLTEGEYINGQYVDKRVEVKLK